MISGQQHAGTLSLTTVLHILHAVVPVQHCVTNLHLAWTAMELTALMCQKFLMMAAAAGCANEFCCTPDYGRQCMHYEQEVRHIWGLWDQWWCTVQCDCKLCDPINDLISLEDLKGLHSKLCPHLMEALQFNYCMLVHWFVKQVAVHMMYTCMPTLLVAGGYHQSSNLQPLNCDRVVWESMQLATQVRTTVSQLLCTSKSCVGSCMRIAKQAARHSWSNTSALSLICWG